MPKDTGRTGRATACASHFALLSMGLFLLLHLAAALLYPGGNFLQPGAGDYSLMRNFWCDLMEREAWNGRPNPGRPFALASLAALALAIVGHWTHLGLGRFRPGRPRWLHFVLGLLALAAFVRIPVDHDLAVKGGILLGSLAFLWLVGRQVTNAHWGGATCAFSIWLLLIANFAVWETGRLIAWLPMLQKVTIILVAVWMLWEARASRASLGRPVRAEHP